MTDAHRPTTALSDFGFTELTLVAVGAAVAGTGWAALLLAQADRFAARPALLVGAVCGLAALAAVLHGRVAAALAALRRDRWGAAALVMALALTAWQRPSGAAWPAALDAGWYLDTAAWIVRAGGLDFRPAALAQLPEGAARRLFVSSFDDQRAVLDPGGGRFPRGADLGLHAVALAVTDADLARARPYHPPFLAALLAVALELAGPQRVADVALVAGFLWLLAIAVLARRLGGGVAGVAGVLLAACGPAFAYYAGQPFAELAAGAALLAGLWLLVAARPRPLAAGLCLGLAALVKVDALPAVAAALVGGFWALRELPRARPRLLAGAAVGLGHLLLLLATVNLVYLKLNGGGVLKLARASWAYLGAGLLAAAVLAIAWRYRPPRWPTERGLALLGAAALAVLAWGQAAVWIAPEGATPSMLAIASWLLTPLGLWLGIAGGAELFARGRKDLAPLRAVVALAVPFVLLAPLVSRGLSPLYAGRRLLVAALPLTAVLAATVLAAPWADEEEGGPAARPSWLFGGGPARPRSAAVAALLLVLGSQMSLAAPFRGARGRDLAGGLSLVQRLAAKTPPDAVIVFLSVLDGSHAGRLAAALEALEGRATAVVGRPEPDLAALSAAVRAWQRAGRSVFLVLDDGREPLDLSGQRLTVVHQDSIITRHLAPRPALPASMTSLPLGIALYAVSPDAGGPP